jgi:hypothetical protein
MIRIPHQPDARRATRPVAGRLILSAAVVLVLAACSISSNLDSFDNGICASGTKACENKCAPVDDPAVGCSLPGCVPCFVTNGVATCGTRTGQCAIAACNAGFADCRDGYDDGCETHVAIDPNNCGACGDVCPAPPNATAGCAGGSCVIGGCAAGWADCDGLTSNGCETPCAAQQACARADGGAGWTCE